MMEFSVNRKDIKTLMSYVSFIIKNYEKDEAYEVCAELLEFNSKLSDYVLGYCLFDDIQQLLYDFLIIEANIIDIDIFEMSVVFEIYGTGQKFFFCDLTLKDLNYLIDLREEQETFRAKNNVIKDEEEDED